MGDSPQLKDYYEKNARNLITTWGGSLNDYASRSWAGLIRDYYAKRWEMYINTFIKAAEKGVEVDQKQLEDELKEIEEGWVNATDRKILEKMFIQQLTDYYHSPPFYSANIKDW